jgi:hypothetical protein
VSRGRLSDSLSTTRHRWLHLAFSNLVVPVATVYILLALALLLLIPFAWYFTRPPSIKKSSDSERIVPSPIPESGVTRTRPDELPPMDYPKPMAPAATQGDSVRVRIAMKRAAKQT